MATPTGKLAPRALILLLFILSGFAGLAYELIWTKELSLIFGVTSGAITTVLAAFMGGLALGSALFGSRAERVRRPIAEGQSWTIGADGERREKSAGREIAKIVLPLAFAILLMISLASSGGFLLQAVAIEKENRVIEVLLASADPDEVCIFFSQDCQVCENCLPPGTSGAISAYIVLMNASEPSGVSGYEFCLCNEDGTPLLPPANCFVTGRDKSRKNKELVTLRPSETREYHVEIGVLAGQTDISAVRREVRQILKGRKTKLVR